MGFKIQIADAETQRQAAVKNYEMGAIRFVLLRGLLKWALPMFVFFTLYDYFVIGYHNAVTASGMMHTALICIVFGLLVGTALWFSVRSKVRKLDPK
jgi:hypothetical protein